MFMPTTGGYADLWASYRSVAQRVRWLDVRDESSIPSFEGWDDPARVVVCWTLRHLPLHRCRAFCVYYEVMDPDVAQIPIEQRFWLELLKSVSRDYDGVFVHTPSMAKWVSAHVTKPVFVLPVGWEPRAMTPALTIPGDAIAVWGGYAPRRAGVTSALHERHPAIKDIGGRYGLALLNELAKCRAALYVAHSKVRSFSTWRLWQCLAADVPLIAEGITPLDTWPFIPGKHVVALDGWLDELDGRPAHDRLDAALASDDLYLVARQARLDLGVRFELERVIRNFLLPAIEATA